MIDREIVNQHLDKIFKSEQFSKSELDKKLLNYLVDASLREEVPKETTIAIDIFGKDSTFNAANDSIVRSHIYSLRKKLQTYYITEGKDDKIQLVIPKGHYKIEFRKNISSKKLNKKNRYFLYASLILIIFLTLSLTYFIRQNLHFRTQLGNKSDNFENPVWANFINSDLPTLFVLGDYFLYYEGPSETGGLRKIRDGGINSMNDLEKYLKTHPDQKYLANENPLRWIGKEQVNALFEILPIFNITETPVKLRYSSELTAKHFEKNNIIYIGSFKNLNILNQILDHIKIRYSIYPHKIYITDPDEVSYKYKRIQVPGDYNYRKDYGLIANVPGPNQNTIMIITSFGSPGISESVKLLTQADMIQNLEKEYFNNEKLPKYFQILLEIDRFGPNAVSEIKHCFEVPASNLTNFNISDSQE